jgi:hypothetical protein
MSSYDVSTAVVALPMVVIFGAVIVAIFRSAVEAPRQRKLLELARRRAGKSDVRGAMAILSGDLRYASDEADRLRLALAPRLAREGHGAEARKLLAIVDAHLDAFKSLPEVSGKCFALSRAFDRAERAVEQALASAPPPLASPASKRVREGAMVGPYRLERRLAEGGFGEVWRAREQCGGCAVALKIPTEKAFVEALRGQGAIQSRLHDPRIVSIIAADLLAEPPYIAMELVEGESLRERLRREAPLAPRRAVRIFGEIARAVEVAHAAGVLHRDLKPENVLLSEGDRVKVTDFGIGEAREAAERPLLRSGGLETEGAVRLAGTPAYMAPEQLAGERVDARADVFALGIILFEMLTGRRPQPGDRPTDFVSGLPGALDEVFERCYTRLEKRLASAGDVLREIERILDPVAS